MKYNKTVEAVFLSRPNRFIAEILVDGEKRIAHVKNTGRCRELLKQGVSVILECSDNPKRSTAYDLVAVWKDRKEGKTLINIDSMMPNKAVGEWLVSSGAFGESPHIRAEYTYKDSRFDFYLEQGSRRILLEVKGVTLEDEGTVMFPDAPTQRGVKHIEGLMDALEDGFECYIMFVVQMKGASLFRPNERMHPEFAEALRLAKARGVNVICYDCIVKTDEMTVDSPVPIAL